MRRAGTDVVPSEVEDIQHAPLIGFDQASTFGYTDGVINLTLSASRFLPAKGRVVVKPVVTAHLRCTRAAALRLRDTLDRVLLMTEPAGTKN